MLRAETGLALWGDVARHSNFNNLNCQIALTEITGAKGILRWRSNLKARSGVQRRLWCLCNGRNHEREY